MQDFGPKKERKIFSNGVLRHLLKLNGKNLKKKKKRMQYCFYGVLSHLIGFYSISDIIFCFHIDVLTF